MKLAINKTAILLFLGIFAVSCATAPVEENLRQPAALEKNCFEMAASLIGSTDKADPFSTSSFPNISLRKTLSERRVLKERYTKVSESIRDFEFHADLPINGKTKLLLDPYEGYLAKIMMIRNAKETIDLSYFIFKGDDTSKALLHELRSAIKRGVKVRILIDSSGSIKKAPFYNDIKALVSLSGRPILDEAGNPTGELAKAEAVLFNPVFNVRAHVANWMKIVHNLFSAEDAKLPLSTFTVNRRSHDKILLIDAQSESNSMSIIGGRNIADQYYKIGKGEENPILDAEIMIKGFTQKNADGSLQNALENHYNKIFYYTANKNFEDFLFKTNRSKVRSEFKKMRSSAEALLDEDEGKLGAILKRMEEEKFLENDFEDGLISILNEIQNLSRTRVILKPNGPQNKANGNSLMKKIHADIAKAQRSIDIVSPYFWMPKEELEFMIEWASKNSDRKVRIFSNSITTTNNVIAQAIVDTTFKETIMKRIKGTPLEKQFEIYSYGRLDDEMLDGNQRYGFLHAKIFIADGKKLTISTSNLDPISRHLNSEVGTSIENLPANSTNMIKMNKYIDELLEHSTQWGTDEWQAIQSHPKNRVISSIQKFVTKIIYTLNLVPLL